MPPPSVARSSTQIASRLQASSDPRRFRGHLGVDTIDLVLDLLADQPNQLGDVGAVEVPRVRQVDVDLPADAAGVRVQHDDPIRQAHRLADRVRDEQDRLVRLEPQLLELLVQQRARLGVEGGERLVHQQDGRVHHQRPGDRDALPHAAGQLVRSACRPLWVRWTISQRRRPRGRRARACGTPAIFRPKSMFCAAVSQGNRPWSWKTIARSGPGPLTRLAVERDGAGVGLDHPGGDVEQRALAAAAGADDDDELARLARQVDPAHRGTLPSSAEVLVDADHLQPAARPARAGTALAPAGAGNSTTAGVARARALRRLLRQPDELFHGLRAFLGRRWRCRCRRRCSGRGSTGTAGRLHFLQDRRVDQALGVGARLGEAQVERPPAKVSNVWGSGSSVNLVYPSADFSTPAGSFFVVSANSACSSCGRYSSGSVVSRWSRRCARRALSRRRPDGAARNSGVVTTTVIANCPCGQRSFSCADHLRARLRHEERAPRLRRPGRVDLLAGHHRRPARRSGRGSRS